MKRALLALALTLAASAPPALAEALPPQLDRLQRADGARVVPETFLRSWDPVTIFFAQDAGPTQGGPEDHPEKFVTLSPAVPGAWQWLGPRALQFRPAEAWKPLQRVRFETQGARVDLAPLLPAPSSASPSDSNEGVADLDQIVLTFDEPAALEALARLMTIEVRPAPGLGPVGGQMLGKQDFDIKALERKSRDDKQSYVVRLKRSIADGRVAILRLALSDAPGLDAPSYELRLRSAPPFVATEANCGRGLDEVSLDGVMRCSVYGGSADEGAGEYPEPTKRRMSIKFSAKPEPLDVVKLRDAVRISPPVDNLAAEVDGNRLRLSGRFLPDMVYDVRLAAGALRDDRKRPLAEGFARRFAFLPDPALIRWDATQGVVERFGPQFLPLRGRGFDRADIRIHAIDPLSRDFWPFPSEGLTTKDEDAPPLPGNEPATWREANDAEGKAIAERIKALGSPAVSQLVALPIQRNGVDARFGLDLKPLFARVAGADQPGAYLVGLRPTDGGPRRWMRVQTTDLTLSAIEEPARVRFVVTSLSTAKPVAEANVRLEGLRDDKFVTLASGRTDANGAFVWALEKRVQAEIKRVVVSKGLDTLVIEPSRAPSEYARENWTKPEEPWLAWTVDPRAPRAETARTLCHVFTERPIYRPEEAVHVKGYVRSWLGGRLSYARGGGTLVVQGPSNQEWRIPVTLDATGGFYHKFDAQTPATGDYSAKFEPDAPKKAKAEAPAQDGDGQPAQEAEREGEGEGEGETPAAQAEGQNGAADAAPAVDPATCAAGATSFKKEAYRLPTFEVLLNGPQMAPLDGSFNVDLLARYFAGGLAADRPITWRAAQFPHQWTPPGREGFLFSTDARFSGEQKFKSSTVLQREARTDASGAARISFDTTIEPTAQPRRYSIEATVTGDDDIQVRNVVNVIATPPFALGLKLPRYMPKPGLVEADALAVDGKGEGLTGLEVTARFIRRNWVSVLQASDFSQGSAKYVTQVIDDTLVEKKITSAKEAQKLAFEAKEAGVYVVQLEANDRIGRRQQVSVDFFVGGETPVTWARAPSQTANVTLEKEAHAPGETATLVIQSPFQTARALAIVEEPGGQYRYDWVEIANGYGRYHVVLAKEHTPKLAVHFLIMRGRMTGNAPNPTAPFDLGKPVTIAATKWIAVTPVKNLVTAKLEYPQKARPGQEVEVTLRLSDDAGQPLAGEATFWMVDQAVLSLAKEKPLDPLPNFIVARATKMAARDTRNMSFGIIPLEETPGGDIGLAEWGAENNISVRKNFTPVPIYLPKVVVGPDGVAKIKVKLPDSLTVFKLRAKAVSGPDRFGFATGEMLIRQELVAQPALPRFVRPGDQLDLAMVARVVEGPGGNGRAALLAEGVTLQGAREQAFAWADNKPQRVAFPALINEPTAGKDVARLMLRLTREADNASDNVQIDLPVRPDRAVVRKHEVVEIAPGASVTLATPQEAVRPGSFSREVTVASDPTLVKLIAGMSALVDYPYGCTEQRIALASSGLALKPFAPLMAASGVDRRISGDIRATAQAIAQAVDPDGLVAFWPKARGNVSLTSWAYTFLMAAQKAGEPIDKTLVDRLGAVLKQSLRSDYARLLPANEMRERVEALTALAEGGTLDQSYTAELARRADAMPNLSVAQMTAAAANLPGADKRVANALLQTLWSRVVINSRNGKPVYGGQAGERADPVILPSETRSLAEMTRAVALAAPDDARLGVLREGLIRLGEGDGWGTTNANAAAIRALAAAWRKPMGQIPLLLTRAGAQAARLSIDANAPVARDVSNEPAAASLANGGQAALVALVETRWRPQAPGAQAQPTMDGFALSRESWRVSASGPGEKLALDAGGALRLNVGDVVEEVAELVNPEDRTHVAISLPIAAGMEPLNPNLATAPAEAKPSAPPTLTPSWVSFGDDRVFYAYDRLPKGNYRFVFRTRAQIAGSFTQPPGEAETMYQRGLHGASAGARVVIGR